MSDGHPLSDARGITDILQIRRAKASDVAGIRKVHARSVQSLGPQHYPGEVVEIWSRPRSVDDYRASIAANSFYVAEKAKEVIGFAELEIHKRLIRSVYVSPGHTRQGVASALLAALEEDALKQGLDEVWLHSSLTAVRFYEASGFDQVQKGRFDLGDGLDMASVQMRKVIR
jgi:putative acetyltransferase